MGSLKNWVAFSRKNGKCVVCWSDLPWLQTGSRTQHSKVSSRKGISGILEPLPDDLRFLQFTLGSTGDAKGVMITQGGLIHNVKLMRRIYQVTSKTMAVLWLSQYHDVGLIGGLFKTMVSGAWRFFFHQSHLSKTPPLATDYEQTQRPTVPDPTLPLR